jgi:hypothetical protein
MGGELPEALVTAFRGAIAEGRWVGLQHWRRVPSFDEPEGFVAGCVWWLHRVDAVEGFDVPEPDPDLTY